MKKLLNIIERVRKAKAIGIIYNLPTQQAALLQNKLLDNKSAIAIRGRDAYTPPMLLNRLSYHFKIKRMSLSMLTTFIEDKVLLISEADMLKPSYNKVLEDLRKYKIPIVLLFNNGHAIKEFRKLPVYHKILTIEQDYNYL
jgi:hypothetical protein